MKDPEFRNPLTPGSRGMFTEEERRELEKYISSGQHQKDKERMAQEDVAWRKSQINQKKMALNTQGEMANALRAKGKHIVFIIREGYDGEPIALFTDIKKAIPFFKDDKGIYRDLVIYEVKTDGSLLGISD